VWLYVPEGGPDVEEGTITVAGFCSGSGMLEIAVEGALGVLGHRSRTVVHCEREAAAAAALVGIAKATGRESPVWDSIESFDGHPWRGKVDIVVAGLPCPAFSVAGRGAGNEDERSWGEGFRIDDVDTWGPQPHFLRIVHEMRPAMVFLENVPPWVSRGHFRVFGEALSRMGYKIEEPLFLSAEAVGASHLRERVFVLAHRSGGVERVRRNELADSDAGGRRAQGDSQLEAEEPDSRGQEELAHRSGDHQLRNTHGEDWEGLSPGGRGGSVANPGRVGTLLEQKSLERSEGSTLADRAGGGGPLANPDGGEVREPQQRGSSGRQGGVQDEGGPFPGDDGESGPVADGNHPESGTGNQGEQEEASRQRRRGSPDTDGGLDFPLFAPKQDDWGSWNRVAELDSSRMPSIESGVPVVADGDASSGDPILLSNNDLLRLGGNAVVPLQAAVAFAALLERAIEKMR